MASNQSYRQVGTRAGGSLAKGPPPAIQEVIAPQPMQSYPAMRPRVKRAVPSIPSKFDTTLHVGQRERDAFGTRTNRFDPSSNDLPGPGNYHRATSFIRTADSVSKLGYGVGFVSKSKRFAAQDRSHMQSTLDPGPGAYNADPLRLRKANFSRAKTTGVFAKPRRYRDDAHIDMQPTPGPGDYNPTLRKVATAPPMFKPQGRQSSTFESKTKRDSYIARASVAPAPGHYKYDTSSFARARRRGRGGAVFRSTEPKLSKLYPATSRGIPGPGAYMKDRLPKQTGVKEAHKPSSMFSNQQCDRFGIPFERKTVDDDVPGPGAYAPTIKTVPRVSASSHVFLSNVNRLGTKSKAVKPPGPAFYKPAPISKKSFLLNASRRWV